MDNEEIAGRLEDLNTRITQLYEWVNTTLRDKIKEYDEEQDQQNNRLNDIEYQLLMSKTSETVTQPQD